MVPASVEVVGQLPELWVPVTGFVVTPVLGWWREPGPVAAQEVEVADVARVPIRDLADPANRVRVRHPSGFVGPGFDVAGMIVWGFTGGLTDGLLRMGVGSVLGSRPGWSNSMRSAHERGGCDPPRLRAAVRALWLADGVRAGAAGLRGLRRRGPAGGQVGAGRRRRVAALGHPRQRAAHRGGAGFGADRAGDRRLRRRSDPGGRGLDAGSLAGLAAGRLFRRAGRRGVRLGDGDDDPVAAGEPDQRPGAHLLGAGDGGRARAGGGQAGAVGGRRRGEQHRDPDRRRRLHRHPGGPQRALAVGGDDAGGGRRCIPW